MKRTWVATLACAGAGLALAPSALAGTSPSILSPAPGSPVTLPTSAEAQGIAFDSRYPGTLSVADGTGDALSGLGVGPATARLGDVGDVKMPAGATDPQAVAANPANDLVAIGADESGTEVILLYRQGATGALTYVTSTSTGLDGDLVGLAWSPDGTELAAASADRVTTFSVGSATLIPESWIVDSADNFVGVAVGDNAVAAIDAAHDALVTWGNANDGLNDEQSTPVAGDTPTAIAYRPGAADIGSDVFAVAENYQDNDKLVQWETVAGNAGQASKGGVSALGGPASSLSFDGDGGMVAAVEGNALSLYALGGGLQGMTTEVPGSPIDSGGATWGSVALNSAATEVAVGENGGPQGSAADVYAIAQPTVTFTADPGRTVTQGQKLTVHFTCHVPDGTTLTYCADSNGGSVATPSTSVLGAHTVEVQVTAGDDIGQSVTVPYDYTVVAAGGTTSGATPPPTTIAGATPPATTPAGATPPAATTV